MAKKIEGVPLSQVAGLLKLNPKNARARLRRHSVPKGMTVGNSWMLTPKGVTWAKAALKRDGRKRA